METCQNFIDSLSLSFPFVTVDNKDTTLLCCDEEHTAQSFTQCKCSGDTDHILYNRFLVSEGPLDSPGSESLAADVKGKPEVCTIYSSGHMSRDGGRDGLVRFRLWEEVREGLLASQE